MLESISWSDFILTLVIVAAIYYGAVVLLYFTADIKRLIARKTDSLQTEVSSNHKQRPTLMGDAHPVPTIREPAPSHIEDSTAIISMSADEDSQRTWKTNEFVTQPLHRSFSQLLEEINALAYIIASNSKEEISLLFETLLSRYPQLAKPHHQSSINQFIIEACQQYGEMTLSHQDIDSWWGQALDNRNT